MRFIILFFSLFFNILHAKDCSLVNDSPLEKAIWNKVKSLDCKSKTVHLTFDDGPKQSTTLPIMKALKQRKVPATFFISTTNLEGSSAEVAANRQILLEMINSGFAVGSHGHQHKAYDLRLKNDKTPVEKPFTEAQREAEIKKSYQLLDLHTGGKFSKQKDLFFRFPYGRGAMPSPVEIEVMESENNRKFAGQTYAEKLQSYRKSSPAMSSISEFGQSHLGWNFDSQDSSSMYGPEDIENYIEDTVKGFCQSTKDPLIALFHDIKELNAKGIAAILDISLCLGIEFAPLKEIATNKALVDNGVVIPKYDLKSSMREIASLEKDASTSDLEECTWKVTKDNNGKKSCYSEYLKENILHCQGKLSICIDGIMLPRNHADVKNICGIEPLVESDDDKLMVGQTCSVAKERKQFTEEIVCYCQFNSEEILKWRCYDISTTPAEEITN